MAAGAKAAPLPKLGEGCELVLTMVPNDPQVKSVMLHGNGFGQDDHSFILKYYKRLAGLE